MSTGKVANKGQNIVHVVCEHPLRNACFQRTFFSGLNGAIICTSIESKDVSTSHQPL
jgi:hypothetical protein